MRTFLREAVVHAAPSMHAHLDEGGYPMPGEVPLWTSVLRELSVAVSLAPLLFADLETKFLDWVYELDASLTGFGIVKTLSSDAEITVELEEGLGSYWAAEVEKMAALQDEVFTGGFPTLERPVPVNQVITSQPRRGRGMLEVTMGDDQISGDFAETGLGWVERWAPSRGAGREAPRRHSAARHAASTDACCTQRTAHVTR